MEIAHDSMHWDRCVNRAQNSKTIGGRKWYNDARKQLKKKKVRSGFWTVLRQFQAIKYVPLSWIEKSLQVTKKQLLDKIAFWKRREYISRELAKKGRTLVNKFCDEYLSPVYMGKTPLFEKHTWSLFGETDKRYLHNQLEVDNKKRKKKLGQHPVMSIFIPRLNDFAEEQDVR